ncbi:hypothetical protein Tco_1539801 [Tanacetum coccineum]
MVLSLCPSVCGWYAVSLSKLVPKKRSEVTSRKFDYANLGSRSHMIETGIHISLTTSFRYNLASLSKGAVSSHQLGDDKEISFSFAKQAPKPFREVVAVCDENLRFLQVMARIVPAKDLKIDESLLDGLRDVQSLMAGSMQ